MPKRTFLTVAFFSFCLAAKAQSVEEVQSQVLAYLNQIEKWDSTYSYENGDDSLYLYDKKLLDYFETVLVKNPATLRYDFPKVNNSRLAILTSDDKRFRIYCWDVGRDAGTRSYNSIIQYQSTKGTKAKIQNDVSKMVEGDVCSGLFYSALYTIETKANKKVYLIIGGGKFAMGLYGFDIQAFTIDDGKLNDSIKFFKTTNGSINSIDYSIEASLRGDNDPRIKLSADKRKVYIPVVYENGVVTSKYLVYVFDGNQFVFDKNAK